MNPTRIIAPLAVLALATAGCGGGSGPPVDSDLPKAEAAVRSAVARNDDRGTTAMITCRRGDSDGAITCSGTIARRGGVRVAFRASPISCFPQDSECSLDAAEIRGKDGEPLYSFNADAEPTKTADAAAAGSQEDSDPVDAANKVFLKLDDLAVEADDAIGDAVEAALGNASPSTAAAAVDDLRTRVLKYAADTFGTPLEAPLNMMTGALSAAKEAATSAEPADAVKARRDMREARQALTAAAFDK